MKFKNSTVLLHIGFTVALLTLLGIFAYTGVSFIALSESNEQVSHTLLVQDMLHETLGLLTDAETSQRGYIITGDEAFLEPYTAALDPQMGIRAHLAELHELTSDDPRQQERLNRLEGLVDAKLESMKQNINLRRTEGFEAAQVSVASGQGKETMDAIRALIQEMGTEESALLQSRSDAASASLRNVRLMFSLGAPSALAMLVAIFILLTGQIRARRRAQESLQKLNAELDQRVTERTAALAESERNYRDLADNALVGIFRSSMSGEILYINETLARMGNFASREAAIQDGAIIRWRDPQLRPAFLQELERAGKVESYEIEVLKATGEPMHVLVSAQIRDNQLVGTVLDITERKRAEQALKEVYSKLELILNASPLPILAADAEGRLTSWNKAAERLFGWTESEVFGNICPTVPPDGIEDYRDMIHSAMEGKAVEGLVRYRQKSSRSSVICRIYASAQRKASGESIGVTIILEDITDRKRAEEALRKSENLFRIISTNSPDVIFAQDRDLRYTWIINPAAPLSADEVIGKTDWDLLPPEEARRLTELKENILKTGESLRQELSLSPGGISRWYDAIYQPLYNDMGQIMGIASYARDITERKWAEQAVRQSEEQYRVLFEDSPIALWVQDFSAVKQRLEELKKTGFQDIPAYLRDHPDFVIECTRQVKVLDVNRAAMKMYHARQKSELLGNLADVLPALSLEAFEAELIQIANGRLNFEREETNHTLTGERIFVNKRWSVAPGYEDSLAKAIVSTMDITERKRVEEERLARETAERANQAKSEFLSRMSHELRTPMNSILGFAQLLKMDELPPDQTSSLDQILKSGRHLLDLINEVLDIARIESGRVRLSPEPVHIAEALEQAVDLIRPLADERGIHIEVRVPSSRDIFITADRQRLRQVMLNLLSNAVKYNRENGEIFVTASLLVDGFLHLVVRDTGEGIPPEKINRLFVAFDRLGLEATGVEGTGLGLVLSKGLVEAMGGRIGAQSVVGEGSTFWFDLKLTTQQKEEVVMAEVGDFLKAVPSPNKGLVLYVEDNLSNVQLIEKILARLQEVELISAMQGQLAMDLARQHKPDLILLDMHLPDIHGEKVLEWLKAEPETRDIPVVVMSADATQHQIERALAAGARAYLTKPIDVKEFLKMIGETLGR